MKTILIASLCAFWAASFSLASVDAIGIGVAEGIVAAGALAVVQSLVAMLFAWCGICAVLGERQKDGVVQNLARLAVAGAAIVFAAMVVAGESAMSGGSSVTAQFAALGVTYLVMKAEMVHDLSPRSPVRMEDPARQMARSAARGTVLAHLSGRRVTAENDA